MDLDQLLSEAAPTAACTQDTRDALRALVDSSRTKARPRRRVRIAAVAGLAALALGGTAAATGAVPSSWIPWTTPTDHACRMRFGVVPADPENGEVNMLPAHIDRARQAREVRAAQAFYDSFDYASIDQQQAISQWQAVQARIAAQGGDPDPSTGDDLALAAVDYYMWSQMRAHLAKLGFDMSEVKGSDLYLLIGTQAWSCAG